MSEPKFVIPSGVQLLGNDGGDVPRLEVFDEAGKSSDPSEALLTEKGALDWTLQEGPSYLADYALVLDDFAAGSTEDGEIGEKGWMLATGASGNLVIAGNSAFIPSTGAKGAVVLGTQTNAAGYSHLRLMTEFTTGAPEFVSEWRLRPGGVSNATDTFVCRIGFGDTFDGSAPGDGFYLEWDQNADANIQCVTADSSTRTTVDGGVAAPAGASATDWDVVGVTCDGAGNVTFSMNSADLTTITTNLPSAGWSPFASITKTAGTNGKVLFVDYFYGKFAR